MRSTEHQPISVACQLAPGRRRCSAFSFPKRADKIASPFHHWPLCRLRLRPTFLPLRYGKGPQAIHLLSRWLLRRLPARDPGLQPSRVSRLQAAPSPLTMAAPKMTKNQMRRAKKKEQKKVQANVRMLALSMPLPLPLIASPSFSSRTSPPEAKIKTRHHSPKPPTLQPPPS